jgi:hypothetical protein
MLCSEESNYSELCHVVDDDSGLSFTGTVLATEEGTSHELRYEVHTEDNYRTKVVHVTHLWPEPAFELVLRRDSRGWQMGREPLDGFDGCVDVDLGFTPSTNTLPIRRLGLEVGERREISVVWILFPEFSAVRGEQSYARVAGDRYVFESGDFKAVLRTNDQGIVLDYEGLWTAKGVNLFVSSQPTRPLGTEEKNG